MNKDSKSASREEIIESLSSFILRVAKGSATPEEVVILPEIVKIVIDYGFFSL